MATQINPKSMNLGWILIGVVLASLVGIGLTFALVSLKIEMGQGHSWQKSKLYGVIFSLSGPVEAVEYEQILPEVMPSKAVLARDESHKVGGVLTVSQPEARPFAQLTAPKPAQSLTVYDAVPDVADIRFDFKAPAGYAPDWRVKRFAMAADIENYEPVGVISSDVRLKPGESRRLYWFNELIDSKGQEVTQSWYYRDALMSRVVMQIGSHRWRASSFKTLSFQHQGAWRVATEDRTGRVLAERRFQVVLAQ